MVKTTAMGGKLARDAGGIEEIVREHFRKHYGFDPLDIDIDMDRLTATVALPDSKIICGIERFFLDKCPLYCILVLAEDTA
jgi:hypothetical protein